MNIYLKICIQSSLKIKNTCYIKEIAIIFKIIYSAINYQKNVFIDLKRSFK